MVVATVSATCVERLSKKTLLVYVWIGSLSLECFALAAAMQLRRGAPTVPRFLRDLYRYDKTERTASLSH